MPVRSSTYDAGLACRLSVPQDYNVSEGILSPFLLNLAAGIEASPADFFVEAPLSPTPFTAGLPATIDFTRSPPAGVVKLSDVRIFCNELLQRLVCLSHSHDYPYSASLVNVAPIWNQQILCRPLQSVICVMLVSASRIHAT